MHFSNQLPPFDKPTLILITSRHNAVGYGSIGRKIEQLFDLHTDTPTYSDNEGHFKRTANGEQYGSGSTEDNVVEIVINEMTTDLVEELDNLNFDYDQIILFVPKQLKNRITDKLPDKVSSKINQTISGNLIHEKPNQFLERLLT